MLKFTWHDAKSIDSHSYSCGWCGNQVATTHGWIGDPSQRNHHMRIYICSHCTRPTIFRLVPSEQKSIVLPAPNVAKKIKGMPDEVKQAYVEACKCLAYDAPTTAVMMCRKLLVYVAVQEGAERDLDGYVPYVNFLKEKGHVPPNAHKMVDHVRKIGNDANHELKPVDPAEAEALLSFMGMLLTFIYTFKAEAEKLSSAKNK